MPSAARNDAANRVPLRGATTPGAAPPHDRGRSVIIIPPARRPRRYRGPPCRTSTRSFSIAAPTTPSSA